MDWSAGLSINPTYTGHRNKQGRFILSRISACTTSKRPHARRLEVTHRQHRKPTDRSLEVGGALLTALPSQSRRSHTAWDPHCRQGQCSTIRRSRWLCTSECKPTTVYSVLPPHHHQVLLWHRHVLLPGHSPLLPPRISQDLGRMQMMGVRSTQPEFNIHLSSHHLTALRLTGL